MLGPWNGRVRTDQAPIARPRIGGFAIRFADPSQPGIAKPSAQKDVRAELKIEISKNKLRRLPNLFSGNRSNGTLPINGALASLPECASRTQKRTIDNICLKSYIQNFGFAQLGEANQAPRVFLVVGGIGVRSADPQAAKAQFFKNPLKILIKKDLLYIRAECSVVW